MVQPDIARPPRSGSTAHDVHRLLSNCDCRSPSPLPVSRPRSSSPADHRDASDRPLHAAERTSKIAPAPCATAISRHRPRPTTQQSCTRRSQIPIAHGRPTIAPVPARGFLPRGFSDACRLSMRRRPCRGRRPRSLNRLRRRLSRVECPLPLTYRRKLSNRFRTSRPARRRLGRRCKGAFLHGQADGRPIRFIRHGGRRHTCRQFTLASRSTTPLILRRHECDQDPLGPGAPRKQHRARLHLGGDGVDSLATCLSAAARTPLVRAVRLSDLSAAGILLVVVRLRRLCPRDLRRGRLYRSIGRYRRDRRGRRHVGVAGTGDQEGHDLRLRALGRDARGPRCWPAPCRGRSARPVARRLSAPRRSRACSVLRADQKRQRRRTRRADAADLAGLGDRP